MTSKSMVSRRDFIRMGTGAAALGAGTKVTLLEPSQLLASPRPVAPSDTVRFGIIGTGGEGCSLLKNSLLVPGFECVAAADLYDGRQTAAREVLGGKNIDTTREYRRLFDRKDIDAILCATPDFWHRRIVEEACQAGKDVYCEKPMSHSVEDGFAMIAAVRKHNRICEVGSQRVSGLLYIKAKEIWDSGKLGMVDAIDACWDRNNDHASYKNPFPADASPQTIDWKTWIQGAPQHPFSLERFFDWRIFKDYGAGMAGDLFVHLLSGIHFVTGTNEPPRRASSFGGIYYYKDDRQFPDLMCTQYEYPKFIVTLRCNTNNSSQNQVVRFFGKTGTMEIGTHTVTFKPESYRHPRMDIAATGGWSRKMREQYIAQYKKEHPPIPTGDLKHVDEGEAFTNPPGSNDQVEHLTNFAKAIRTRGHVVEDEMFGNNTSIGCHMANQSYLSRTVVAWDASAQRIKNT